MKMAKITNFYMFPDSNNKISVIDTKASNIFPIGTISIRGSANQGLVTTENIAVDPNKGNIYIASSEYDKVSIYDPTIFIRNDISQEVESIQTGKNPYDVKIDQHTGNVYVNNLQSEFINVFSRDKSFPTQINVSDVSYIDIESSGNLYVGHKHSGNISRYTYDFETKEFQNTRNITIGYPPSSIFVDEYYYRLLVSGNNMLKVYDLGTVETNSKYFCGIIGEFN